MRTLRFALLALAPWLAGCVSVMGQPPAESLRTVAERTNYTATSTSDDVKAFVDALAASSGMVRVSSIGKSGQGKDIPLITLADPPIATREEFAKSNKLLILAVGNIHAGEVDAKEALLALLRDIAAKPEDYKDLLSRVVLAVVPNYNPDGNDAMSKDSRPGQIGPEQGQGRRENAAGLDLNRDFVKLEAPETRSLIRFIRTWDPALVIDGHTTNGSYHRYPLTYSGPKHPAGDRAIIDYVNKTMLPGIGARVKDQGFDTFFYGNFAKDHTQWVDYPDQPRYGIPYVGLRNRLAILTESYAYATYETRIKAQHAFIRHCFLWTAENHDHIRSLISKADDATSRAGRDPAEKDTLPIRTIAKPFDEKPTVKGYEERTENGRRIRTDTTKDYTVEHVANFVPELSVRRAFAYVLPPSPAAVETLQRHGIQVDELREQVEVDAEVYKVEKAASTERPFQGHQTRTVDVSARHEPRTLAPGTLIVRSAQRLGTLAGLLLEPSSTDGLATWNFFDDSLNPGADFPVARIVSATPLLTVPLLPLEEDRAPPRPITFEDLRGPDAPNLSGSPTGGHQWLPDGERFRQSRDGRTRTINARTGRAEPLVDADPAVIKALAAIPAIGDKSARAVFGRAQWNEDRSAFYAEHENDLYFCTADGASARRLTSTPQPEELTSFSPDGRLVAFVRDNNLFVVDTSTATERALTTTGSKTLLNAKHDWVYFEELYNRNWRAYWWSPDSSRIAYYQTDTTPVPTYVIVNNALPRQSIESTTYPKSGEPNPLVKIFTVSTAGGTPAELDLSAYQPDNMLVSRVFWRPDSSGIIATVTNRVQTWMDLVAGPAAGGPSSVLFRETTQAWIDESPTVHFLRKDGSFLFSSERTGYKHFYHYAKDGKLLRAVTQGPWETRAIARVDEDAGLVYVTAMKDNPIGENLYRVKLDGSDLTRLTTEPGSHRVSVAPKGELFIDFWSSREHTPRVALRSLTDGSPVRTLDTNPVRDLAKYTLGESSAFQITTPDGFALEATLVKPHDFDPARKYPIWFMTYAGPAAPTISDTWNGAGPGRTWDHALASAGILAFRADPRSASGKGALTAWTCYKKLGQGELKDIETAITWLTAKPFADPARVGMAGHSYGGYITVYAMTNSKLFSAGISGAPVTDWREYDTIYTERHMLTPQDNPEGYKLGSVIESAKNLHGRLLLTHGMMDDNVHLQNNTRFIRALQSANAPFEMMLYPEARHSIGGRHYQQLQVDFIKRTMLEAPAPAR